MRARIVVTGIFGVLLLLAALFFCTDRLPRTSIPGGGELRVLQTSLGTNHFFSPDPFWKIYAARALPKKLHGSLRTNSREIHTHHNSLVVWLGQFEKDGSPSASIDIKKAETLFPNGKTGEAYVRTFSSNIVFCQFPIYPRNEPFITLRLRTLTGAAELKIQNEQVTEFSNWKRKPIPQTNALPHSSVILRGIRALQDRYPFQLRLQGLGKGKAGWTAWRVDLFDRLGNWAEFNTLGNPWRPESLTFAEGPLKLMVHPAEYIPSGMIALPSEWSIATFSPDPRAIDLGLEQIILLGAGHYHFENKIPDNNALLGSSKQTPTESQLLSTTKNGKWMLEVKANQPALLILFTSQPRGPILNARLRERKGTSRSGKTFETVYPIAATNPVHPWELARLFPLTVATTESKLEAEVIALHPPVEFFIEPGFF